MPGRLLFLGIMSALAAHAQAQEPITLKGHAGWIGAVAFAPDSRTLAIGAGDGSVSLWDVMRAEKIAHLKGHDDAVAALAWSPDGGQLVSGGHDHVAILHSINRDPKKLGPHHVLRGHTGAVLSVALPVPGQRLYTGSIDGSIREWDIETRRSLRVERQHSSWVNGLAADQKGALLASASSDQSLQVRRLDSWDVIRGFQVKEGEIRAVAIAPDARFVAAGIRYGGIRVWDLASGREVAALKAHAGETWAVAFTPNGKTLVSAGGDWNKPGEVRLWEVGSWKERLKLQHTGEVLSLSVSPDGRWLAAGSWDRTVRIWNLPATE